MMARIICLVFAVSLLVGCATNPDKIGAAYVSPLKYKDYDCSQIAMEMDFVGQRTIELYTRLKKEARKDSTQMGIGLVLFWPALFLLEGGDGHEAGEFAQLKGEFEALHGTSVQKECGIERKSPEEIIKEAREEEKKKKKNKSDET